jgi:phage baseplate assembly protein W
MRVFSHPLRVDNDGAVATVEQGSVVQAQQLAIGIVSTFLGERPLAPDFGIFDPVAVGLSSAEVVAAVDLCEPDLTVTGVEIADTEDLRQAVTVTVAWDDDGEDA